MHESVPVCVQYIAQAEKQLAGLEGMLEAARLAAPSEFCGEAERLQLVVREACLYARDLGRKMKVAAAVAESYKDGQRV